MLESELEKILDRAISLGASYADVRYQQYDYELITVENKALKSYSSRRLSGIGIRVAIKGSVGYGSTSDLSRNSISKALDHAFKASKSIKSEKEPYTEAKVNKSDVKLSIFSATGALGSIFFFIPSNPLASRRAVPK